MSVFNRLLHVFAGIAAGIGVGGIIGACSGLITGLFSVGFNVGTAFFSVGVGACLGAVAGGINGFILSIMYQMCANPLLGLATGAAVSVGLLWYANNGSFIGDVSLIFFLFLL